MGKHFVNCEVLLKCKALSMNTNSVSQVSQYGAGCQIKIISKGH